MNKEILKNIAKKLTAPPKGILAIDESMTTCNTRFEKLGVLTTEEKRREYRELLVTAPEIEQYVSGYITFDETIRQSSKDGRSFPSVLQSKGINIGIKVDKGVQDLSAGSLEKLTIGLESLSERLKEYKGMGATFAKWRAVYTISENTPSEKCMQENAKALAQYSLACQNEDMVPMVEPEVLLDGNHSIEKCYEVITHNLDVLFAQLKESNVFIPGIILKTSMVMSGKDRDDRASAEKVAELTVKVLREHVPEDIGGIVFLSGGQTDEEATLNLNAMHKISNLPWNLTFSYGRAIQNPALKAWAANPADISTAQKLLVEAAHKNSLASTGQYK